MAAISGKQGSVTYAAGVSNVLSWSIDATADVADASVMDATAFSIATHWKAYIAGLKDWTATVECDLDDSGIDPDLDTDFAQVQIDTVDLILYTGMVNTDQQEGVAARKYTGKAIITNISPSVDMNDVAKITYSFQGTGALAVAESTAT